MYLKLLPVEFRGKKKKSKITVFSPKTVSKQENSDTSAEGTAIQKNPAQSSTLPSNSIPFSPQQNKIMITSENICFQEKHAIVKRELSWFYAIHISGSKT